jgi:hypothetical protein
MALLRFRFELKTGTTGVQLRKLAHLAEDFQRFLQMVGEDLGTQGLTREWQAVNFYNSSVGFDIEHIGEIDERQAHIYSRTVNQVSAYDPRRTNGHIPSGVRKDTLLQYATFGQNMDTTDALNLGFFLNRDREPQEWHVVSKSTAVAVAETLNQIVEYRGMIQGIVHSLYKESQPPHFDVRELSKQELVKCFYRLENYTQVIELLRNRRAVVLVSGTIKARRIDRKIEDIRVEKMRSVEPLSPEEFDRLHGSVPNITGGVSTSDFIERVRYNERDGGE